jgi:hypothetical protein
MIRLSVGNLMLTSNTRADLVNVPEAQCVGVGQAHDLGRAYHPYRWRTWLRGHLPWLVINAGVASKGEDCEKVGGGHLWYNHDDRQSGCYHCKVIRPGRLWGKA